MIFRQLVFPWFNRKTDSILNKKDWGKLGITLYKEWWMTMNCLLDFYSLCLHLISQKYVVCVEILTLMCWKSLLMDTMLYFSMIYLNCKQLSFTVWWMDLNIRSMLFNYRRWEFFKCFRFRSHFVRKFNLTVNNIYINIYTVIRWI